MASTYTANNGIEKIGSGEQAGTWGTTTNTNLDIIDRAINGVGSIALTGTASNLTTTDGTLSNGHYKVVAFTGSLSAGHTVTISPNDQDKLYFVYNNSGDTLTFSQGSGDNVTVANGKNSIIYADGAGAGAAVAKIEPASDVAVDATVKTSDGAILNLQTSDTSVEDGNTLGAIQFAAPDESGGTDAITTAAAIVAEADATFAADANNTDLVFKLGASEAATEKMRLTHEGDLNLITDGKSINFGADSEVQLTHHADTGLKIKHTATADDKPVILTLQTGETDIASGDVLGAIEFQAPDEGEGTDAIVSAGRIEVQSEGDFSATNNAAMIVFKTGVDGSDAGTPLEKFRIESTGSCGIAADGSTSANNLRIGASADLKIYHDGSNSYVNDTGTGALILKGSIVKLESDGGEYMLNAGANGAVNLYYDNASKLETTAGGVTVSDTLTATTVTETSDERLKSDITTIEGALNKVMSMRGVTYTMKAEKGMGVIAQEVEKIIPEVVTTNEYKSVAYGNMVGVLIEAIKDLKKELDEHKQGCNCGSSD